MIKFIFDFNSLPFRGDRSDGVGARYLGIDGSAGVRGNSPSHSQELYGGP